jgi:hypothetical protein
LNFGIRNLDFGFVSAREPKNQKKQEAKGRRRERKKTSIQIGPSLNENLVSFINQERGHARLPNLENM